jgi:hypothetical protein
MAKGFTYPLDWVASAMSNTVVIFLIYFISIGLGINSVIGYFDWSAFWGAAWFLALSPGSIIGLLFFPLNIYIIWSLIYEKHNPFVLFALTVCIAALLTVNEEGEISLTFLTPLILAPAIYILFTAWFQPMRKFILWIKHR